MNEHHAPAPPAAGETAGRLVVTLTENELDVLRYCVGNLAQDGSVDIESPENRQTLEAIAAALSRSASVPTREELAQTIHDADCSCKMLLDSDLAAADAILARFSLAAPALPDGVRELIAQTIYKYACDEPQWWYDAADAIIVSLGAKS